MELHDEIADLKTLMHALVDELAPNCWPARYRLRISHQTVDHRRRQPRSAPVRILRDALRDSSAACLQRGKPPATASIVAGTEPRTLRLHDRRQPMAHRPSTRPYVAPSEAEKRHSNPEILRLLKRYIAREIYLLR